MENNIRGFNLYFIGVLGGNNRENGEEVLWKEIMGENFLELVKDSIYYIKMGFF